MNFRLRQMICMGAFGMLLLASLTACHEKESAEEGAKAPAAEESSEPIATIEGEKVGVSDFLEATRRLPPATRQGLQDPAKRKEFFEEFLQDKLLYVEAKRRGLDKDPETAKRVEQYAERLAVQALRRDLQRDPVDDAAIEKFYQDHIPDFTQERSRFSMILKRRPPNRTPEDDKRIEQQVRDIYRKLKGGADFAKMAEKESEEPRSNRQGGDLGYSSLDRWSSRVAEVGDSLKVGEISEPFQVGYGWIILKRTSAAQTTTAPLSEVKPRIAQMLRKENMDDFAKQLRTTMKVDVDEGLLNSLDLASSLPMPGNAAPLRGPQGAHPGGIANPSGGQPEPAEAPEEGAH